MCFFRPLQRSPICTDIQAKVLECYRKNTKQPLKCAKEVEEFVQCVQAARVVSIKSVSSPCKANNLKGRTFREFNF